MMAYTGGKTLCFALFCIEKTPCSDRLRRSLGWPLQLLLGRCALLFTIRQTLLAGLLFFHLGFGTFIHALGEAGFKGRIPFGTLQRRIRTGKRRRSK